tara:strand:+ start:9419 stop:9646 length:228 start_codon:yes stop_codon:yes gene_type:complete
MKRYLLIIVLFIAFVYTQDYCAGDQISLDHQNAEHVVGAGTEDYADGSSFKLSDWNGDLNGGEYHVIFVDMSASW